LLLPRNRKYAALAALMKIHWRSLKTGVQNLPPGGFLYDNLLRLGFEIPIKPEGAFYIYANCKKFTDDSYQFALDFLELKGLP